MYEPRPIFTFSYERLTRGDHTFFRAHFFNRDEHHCGEGGSAAEAAFRATKHWLRYEKKRAQTGAQCPEKSSYKTNFGQLTTDENRYNDLPISENR